MANHQFSIFFSWQSDIKENKSIIRSGINDACYKLKQSNYYQFLVDEATRNLPGSPNIEESVKTKIEHCDVFVADITPIAQYGNKQLPNPNVLIELGYALRCIDVARIIIVAKADDYQDKDLPFDINHQRIGKFDGAKCNLDFEIEESIKYVLDNGKFKYIRFFNDIHLQQNISIGKYLPDIFLEDSDFKEHLRCFVSPYVFYTKLFNDAKKLNFDYYNQTNELKGKTTFDFSIAPFSSSIKGLCFTDASKRVNEIIDYLKNKISELEQRRSNSSYFAQRKIEDITRGFEYCNKRICLITGKAGQGKTNMVCDLVENVILKRDIPFVYLNGSEIDANNIGNTIAKSLYPEENFSLGDLLNYIQRFCSQQNKHFIVIIDGLNEHENASVLKTNLQQIIKTLLDYDFIRIVVTCRTEYYDANFNDLLSLFTKHVIVHKSYSHLDEHENEMLIDDYCEFFKINAFFDNEIKREFGANLLLLRIYCETYKNQVVGVVNHIRKDDLFLSYYKTMCKRFETSMQNIKEADISFFTISLVKLMLDQNSFSSIPINNILKELSPDQKKIFYRFIDSNILIKRELSNRIFNNEVIGFTFDEFRDFMISHYLIDTIFDKNKPEAFVEQVTLFTSKNHILREGLMCFLYCYSKENNTDVLNILKKQDWYKEAFVKYIWEIKEESVDKDDIHMIKEFIVATPKYAKLLLRRQRWNPNRYKKININILINLLLQFSDDQLRDFLDLAWNENDGDMYHYRENTRDIFIEDTKNALENPVFLKNEYWYNALIPILFLSPFSWNADLLFSEYYNRYREVFIPVLQSYMSLTKSNKIKKYIESL